MKIKSSVKAGWSTVVLLVLLLLAGAMGLRNLTAFSGEPVLIATGSAPVPPSPWMTGSAPVPPSPWNK